MLPYSHTRRRNFQSETFLLYIKRYSISLLFFRNITPPHDFSKLGITVPSLYRIFLYYTITTQAAECRRSIMIKCSPKHRNLLISSCFVRLLYHNNAGGVRRRSIMIKCSPRYRNLRFRFISWGYYIIVECVNSICRDNKKVSDWKFRLRVWE